MAEFSVLLSAKEGQTEALANVLQPLVEASQREEGAVMYDLHASGEGLFVITEKWQNQKLLDAHEATPHFTSFQRASEGLIDSVVRLPKTA
ncbi:putative quinol monooxygenase [Alteromonas gracilis]|uniref:putative quinol monooxygenase n=1 Tax=Alteromonas gracilis TaxID=1479524 RepID=UPI0030CCCF9D